MVFPSSWISQSIQNQNSMFAGLQGFGQTTANGGQGFMNGGPPSNSAMGGVPPPPPPTTLGAFAKGGGGYSGGPTAGAFSEAMAGRMVAGASGAMSLAGAGITGLGVLGSMGMMGGLGTAAAMASPMSAAMSAGMGAYGLMGGGMLGMAGGGLAAAGVGLPMYAGAAWAGGLAKNFVGGMQDQMSLNSNLRQNFNFMGGQGAFGRGFSQSQMGAIGGMVSGELRNNLFTSAQEMNSVIAGGAQMGSFTGVRDVQEFSKKFKEMLGTLKTVQKELGGSLTDALSFVSESRAAGVFGPAATARFAGTIRNVSASTGLQQGQLMQLSMQGAQLSRSVGGRGEQGAIGAMRGLSTVSTALQAGQINEAMLSEATGGRTGTDAMTSFVTDMMQNSARFSRSAPGRYSIFGLSNASGTGLDQSALMAMQMGDMSAGELSRRARHNVGSMGRANAVNREGLLRGAMMEQGGISGQLGMMRMMVGDRAMDGGDDLMSLVMQRRLHMSRPQAEIMTSLMRNQGSIAVREAQDSASSTREAMLRNDIKEHRSVDAFTRNLEHSIADETGMLKAKDMGRTFVTRISSMGEKLLNDMLGISSTQMNQEGQQAMRRLSSMQSTRADLRILGVGTDRGAVTSFDPNNRGILETGPSVADRLRSRGMAVSTSGTPEQNMRRMEEQMRSAQAADSGILTSTSDIRAFKGFAANEAVTANQFIQARIYAQGSGRPDDVFARFGAGGNGMAAFASNRGWDTGAAPADNMGRLEGRGIGGSRVGWSMVGRDALRLGGAAVVSAFTGGLGVAAAGAAVYNSSEILQAMGPSRTENAADFLASGGHEREALAARAEALSNRVGAFESRSQGRTGRNSRTDGVDGAEGRGPRATSRERFAHQGDERELLDVRRQLTGISDSSVTRESVLALQGNSEVMGLIRNMQTGDRATREAALNTFTTYTAAHGEGASGGTLRRLQAQAKGDFGRYGSLGSSFAALTRDPEQEARARYARERQAGNFISFGTAGGGALGSAMANVGNVMRSEAAMVSDGRGGTRKENAEERITRELGAQSAYREQILNSTPEQFQTFSANMLNSIKGDSDEANAKRAEVRGMMMEGRQIQATDRNMQGLGRRGAQGAYEAALGVATGHGAGEMSFNVGSGRGQRTLQGRAAGRALQDALSGRGGAGGRKAREAILAQFHDQAETTLGYTHDMATEAQTLMTNFATASRTRGGLTGEEGTRARRALEEFQMSAPVKEANARANRQRSEQALSSASARDPVGAKQIELLDSINNQLKGKTVVPTEHP